MKSLLIAFLSFFYLTVQAAPSILWVEIGVDGLTCSQCTRNVELSIRRLPNIKHVEMDLEQTNGKITFADSANIEPAAIAKAIRDAGFSVRYIHTVVNFDSTLITDDKCISVGKDQYQFVKTGEKVLNGETVLKLVGKDFLPQREYKKWKMDLKPACPDAVFVTL